MTPPESLAESLAEPLAERPAAAPEIAAVLLAGGLSRRMGGGDKCLRELGGRTLLARIIATIRPQVAALALNANGDAARFAAYDLPVVADPVAGFPGPLAGILAGMRWAAAAAPGCRWLWSLPTDTPFPPPVLATRLLATVEAGATIATCASGGRRHPAIALWPVALADALERALVQEDLHKIEVFTGRYARTLVEWPTLPYDPFFNANGPEDLIAAERLLRDAASRETP